MKTRKELTAALAKRYRSKTRTEKTIILNEFVAATGYTRSYAALLLRSCGTKTKAIGQGTDVVYVAQKTPHGHAGGRPSIYTDDVRDVVERLWRLFGYLCGKRLVPVIHSALPYLNKNNGFVQVSAEVTNALRHISPATVDRMLRPSREAMRIKGTSYTRGSPSLLNQIPVRTFGQWQDVPPGHAQIDLVGHDGGIASGQCCFTLTGTDVCLEWTERRAVLNRAARWVKEALDEIRSEFPVPLIEIHPDSGSEFINHTLIDYCTRTGLMMTRSRSGKKNDNCYVEQKNFDTVRKLVGYARYTTPQAVQLLNELYRTQGLLQNYIYPSQKLIEKQRIGSKVIKHYDSPKTPADRLLEHLSIADDIKACVHRTRSLINPIKLASEVLRLQSELLRLAVSNPSTPYPQEKPA